MFWLCKWCLTIRIHLLQQISVTRLILEYSSLSCFCLCETLCQTDNLGKPQHIRTLSSDDNTCMCECTHTNGETPAWFLLSSCPPYCSSLHTCSVPPQSYWKCPVHNPLIIHISTTFSTKNSELFVEDGQFEPCACCVPTYGCMFPDACVRMCVLSELEQAALGGVFCCSWGATVLSPNRSLVPAVVPREGFWMRGSNFTHSPPSPSPARARPPPPPLRSLGTGQETKRECGWGGMGCLRGCTVAPVLLEGSWTCHDD